MSDLNKRNTLNDSLNQLFEGIDGLINSKTVVGEPKVIGDVTIIPLMDISCGMAAGSFNKNVKNNAGGGASAKVSPAAILIIQNGVTKLINVKNQDVIGKALDLVPDIINKFSADKKISAEDINYAKEYIEEIDNK